MEKGSARNFKFSAHTSRRLKRLSSMLGKSDTAILEDAIAHLLATIEEGEKVWITTPSELRKGHKRPDDAA